MKRRIFLQMLGLSALVPVSANDKKLETELLKTLSDDFVAVLYKGETFVSKDTSVKIRELYLGDKFNLNG